CAGCRACLRLGCPAISWIKEDESGEKKRKGRAAIEPFLCNGCSLCAQVCKFEAIEEEHGK
ncbi:MAG: 4Fe-4S dicluster domain-containing protein, partial [Deltaproteobacteria bacterium]|nr:4Fe-4S dicluster domain-containing protein [Deltaproteobacteria bacterium]